MGYAARRRGTYEERKAAAIERQEEERAARIKAMDEEMDRRDEERRKMSPEERMQYSNRMATRALMIGLLAGMVRR